MRPQNTLFLFSALLALACAVLPARAGSFDGKWLAEMPPQAAPCNTSVVMEMVVMGGTVMGQIVGHTSFSGKLDADGSGTVAFGAAPGILKFSGDHFEIDWTTAKCGHLVAMGDRAPTEAQQATLTAERKQYQARFADLTARANEGDATVDYTALRAAYPYTDKWDPYGNKTASLLQEAQAAQKGGDCLAALDKLDDVLKNDFTIDGAHALRSDCLKAGGDLAKAKIESNIADALVRSLMTSGDGMSEKTAYIVGTMREEADVLANRHITLKTRQTNVRGSDGHYYDLVQGVTLKGGAKLQAVYFDISAFVNGRVSRSAVIATTIAAMTHD